MDNIKSVIIVNQQGTQRYGVGEKYNDRLLHHIENHSLEFDSSYHSIFIGYTDKGERVFETYNAPTDVNY